MNNDFLNDAMATFKKGLGIAMVKAKDFTKVAKDKTSTMVDITKLNITLNETENKIQKCFAKIGKATYDLSVGNETLVDIEAICDEVTELKETAENIRAQIAELKNTEVCEKCGESIPKNSEFCGKCGAKVCESEETDTVIEVTEFPED